MYPFFRTGDTIVLNNREIGIADSAARNIGNIVACSFSKPVKQFSVVHQVRCKSLLNLGGCTIHSIFTDTIAGAIVDILKITEHIIIDRLGVPSELIAVEVTGRRVHRGPLGDLDHQVFDINGYNFINNIVVYVVGRRIVRRRCDSCSENHTQRKDGC